MEIIDIGVYTVEVIDERGYHSTVSPCGSNAHGDKWYCLRCSRYRCEHALFVQTENPTLVTIPLDKEQIALIIDGD